MEIWACLRNQIQWGWGCGQKSHPRVPSAGAGSWWMRRRYSSLRALVKYWRSVRKKSIMQRCSYTSKAERCEAASKNQGWKTYNAVWSRACRLGEWFKVKLERKAKDNSRRLVCVKLRNVNLPWELWGATGIFYGRIWSGWVVLIIKVARVAV